MTSLDSACRSPNARVKTAPTNRSRLRTVARALPVAAMLAAPPVALQVPIVRASLIALADFLRHGGVEALGVYAAVYVVGAVLTLPMGLLSGLAGFAWGWGRGFAAALPAATLGATSAFVVGAVLSRTRWAAPLREHPRFRLIDAVVRADGLRIATLLRLSPLMPQNFLSYALGATPLKAWQFALATAVGMLPATAVQVLLGSLVHDAAELISQRNAHPISDARTWGPAAALLLVTVGLVAVVMRVAKRALDKAMREARPEATEPAAATE